MKFPYIALVILLFAFKGNAQALVKKSLSSKDRKDGVSEKFSYADKSAHGEINLLLKRYNTYSYSVNSGLFQQISEGTWRKIKGGIELESAIQKHDVPIEISDGKIGRFVDDFNIAIVRNINGELVTSAFVLVNNDTVKCLPMIGQCNCYFKTIDSIKIQLENGMTSKWMPVRKDQKKVVITILTAISIEKYLVMPNQRYRLSGSHLIPL